MINNGYQKMLKAVRRWFEITRLPTKPVLIPVKVPIDKAKHCRPMDIRQYRASQQRFKR
jgi:hypothetical protein